MVGRLSRLVIQPELIHRDSQFTGERSGVARPRTVDSLFPSPEGPVADAHPPRDCCGREGGWDQLGSFFADRPNPIHVSSELIASGGSELATSSRLDGVAVLLSLEFLNS
jgi:hypothetical protein